MEETEPPRGKVARKASGGANYKESESNAIVFVLGAGGQRGSEESLGGYERASG